MTPAEGELTEADEVEEPCPDDVSPGSPAWLVFEKDVAEAIGARFDDVTITHNAKVPGLLSGRLRQIDVLVEGEVAGSAITIVVECKRNATTKIKIGTIDAFAGKLLDLGAERGVIWSFGGFDGGAIARAEGAVLPKIELRTPDDAFASRPFPDEFFSADDCPNSYCWGEVSWGDTRNEVVLEEQQARSAASDEVKVLTVGHCGSCGTFSGLCPDCAEVTALDGSETLCFGCGGRWLVRWDSGGSFQVGWERSRE